jgi:hypothetical protein
MTTRTVQFLGQGYSTPPAEGLALTPTHSGSPLIFLIWFFL